MGFNGSKEDEEKSADEASSFLVAHGMKQKDVEIIREMILGTRHLLTHPLSLDAQLIADLDLVSLALSWDDFRANTEKIRQEYSSVPTEIFHEKQKAFLKKLIEVKPSIYLTDFFREKYETQAKENIERYYRE
jgi:predicted metal-dependent HD superfamily phosphohydrolase